MRFIFPAIRVDPCEELNVWRFQRCTFCGWAGNATTNTKYMIERDVWNGWRIDGRHWDSLRDWFVELELCQPPNGDVRESQP